ncbi:MAG TPA: Clp protease N-terminal domain-containing protein [Actinomycetota bacterium]|jgi:ATP-dependent Clp protease ATP-binding subunit ClpA
MFERFTKEARMVVTGAQELARRSGADHIGTEHILLGLAASGGVAASLLSEVGATGEAIGAALDRLDDAHLLGTLGIDVGEVRASVERVFGPGAWAAAGASAGRGGRKGGIPFTADAKKALELSLREAIAIQGKTIEGGHILLGLLRTGGRPVEVLAGLGVDTAALRRRIQEAMRQAS